MITLPQFAAFHFRRLFAALLIVLIFGNPVVMLAGSPAAPPDPQPQLLQITILDGEGALNNIRQRTAREPIVEVKDKNHKPVAGALILFTIHSNGPAGATFNGSQSLSVTTDATGRAVGSGLTPNNKPGEYTIMVTATLGAVTSFVIIHQKNVKGPRMLKHHSTSRIIRWTAIGTVVVVGTVLAVVLTHNSGTNISTGPGSVGAP